jgi:photosystem II stability/assembly factor-like uncharacterized protein
LIEERLVFERFHEALDVQPPPGAFDRLEATLARSTVRPQRRPWLDVPLPRINQTLVAGLLLVVLMVAVIAAFLAVQRPPVHTVPIRPSNPSAAQLIPEMMVGNVGWACCPSRTNDGGLTWQDVSPPTPATRTKGGSTTYFLDANHAWVTVVTGAVALQNGTKVVIFATTDGGQTWSQGDVPVNGVVSVSERLDFIDAQHGWVIVDSGPTALDKTNTAIVNQPLTRAIYTTTDGGANWSRLVSAREGDGSTLGTLALGCSISGLTFVSAERGWLTWDCTSSNGPTSQSTPSDLAVTQDGGRSWQPVYLPASPSPFDYTCGVYPPVFTHSQGVLPVFCGGNGRPGFTGVYSTDDAGTTWSFRNAPFFTQQLDFVDANTGWAFGTTGVTLYRTTDGGRNWAVIKAFASEQNVGGFRFLDTRTGFVLTSRYAPDGMSGFTTMWKTTDGGQSWSVMSLVSNTGRFP